MMMVMTTATIMTTATKSAPITPPTMGPMLLAGVEGNMGVGVTLGVTLGVTVGVTGGATVGVTVGVMYACGV